MDYVGIPSGDFEREILENIRRRAHFIVLLTPTSLERCGVAGDILAKEIEEALRCRRNIVPLFLEGFSFGSLEALKQLTKSIEPLSKYNGMSVPREYFEPAMDRLCSQFLNAPLEAIAHPEVVPSAREDLLAGSSESVSPLLSEATESNPLGDLVITRHEMGRRIDACIARLKVQEGYCVFCYLDIDRFRLINRNLGEAAGDNLLMQIGSMLRSKINSRDSVARMGGDEFGILMEDTSPKDAFLSAEEMRVAVSELRFEWGGQVVELGVSIGLAEILKTSNDCTEVFGLAEDTCQESKLSGSNQVTRFVDDIESRHRRREGRMAYRLLAALASNRLELYRMPIVPLSGVSNGLLYEVHVRMKDEFGGIVAPDSFVHSAESYNISSAIDRWVVENTFRWLSSGSASREQLQSCSINLSEQSLKDEKFVPFLLEQFGKFGVDGTKICFEMSETVAVANFGRVNRLMLALSDLKCEFALDDFGTGLSSFGYLRHLPVQYLKIDGSFVREILNSPIDREMVRSITEIGHLTGKRVIAEWAETFEIVSELKLLGVDFFQGYAVGLPSPIPVESVVH